MIGIVDSGVGGLTVLRRVRERFPRAPIVYLADQVNLPFGKRSPEELAFLLRQYVGYLQHLGATRIVTGCNTLATAARIDDTSPFGGIPITDIISPAVRHVAQTGMRRIGVLATEATVSSGLYGRALRAAMPYATIQEVAAPQLVPLVESGRRSGDEVESAVARARAAFTGDIDLLVLACTHFPWLWAAISNVFGTQVRLLDPGICMVDQLKKPVPGPSTGVSFVTTGDCAAFREIVERLLGPVRSIDRILRAPLFETSKLQEPVVP